MKFFSFQQLRLSEHVIPVHYDLFLHPDLVTGIFSGKVVITLDIQQPTDEIILHSHLLNITFVQFTAPDTTTLLLVWLKSMLTRNLI